MEVTKKQAATVVRTAVQQVASTARQVTYEENADVVIGYEWLSTLDGKTSSICRALDGQTFKTGEGPLPPIHPNCRSSTVPTLDPAFDFLDKGATRSSADGYVDADLSYYDWLKTQNNEFQDHVLGPTRAKLFRDGGLTAKEFGSLQLDKNFDPITLNQMKQLEPLAFERAFGGLDHYPASLDDLELLTEGQKINARAAVANLRGMDPDYMVGDDSHMKENPLPFIPPHQLPPVVDENLGTLGIPGREGAMKLGRPEIVKFADILSPQPGVVPKEVLKYIDDPFAVAKKGAADNSLPTGLRYKGKVYITDGNHRLSAQYLLGLEDAEIRVLELDHMGRVSLPEIKNIPAPRPKLPPSPIKGFDPLTLPGRPGVTTSTGKVWQVGDELYAKLGRFPTRQEMLAAAEAHGINPSTVSVQFGKWKNAYGQALGGGTPITPPVVALPTKIEKAITVLKEKTVTVTGSKEAIFEALQKDLTSLIDENGIEKSWDDLSPLQKAQKELASITKKYGDSSGGLRWAKLETEGRSEYVKELLNTVKRAGAEGKKLKTSRELRDVIIERLEKLNGGVRTQVVKIAANAPASDKENLRYALEFIDKVVHKDLKEVAANFVVDVNRSLIKKGTEAYYRHSSKEIVVKPGTQSDTIAHEFGHKFEHSSKDNPALLRKIAQWLDKRRKNESWRNFGPGHDFKIFSDEWMKRGGSDYTARLYTHNGAQLFASEVISTGLERMYRDPASFLAKDPDHFFITVRTLLNLW